jgi:hypothetical protein
MIFLFRLSIVLPDAAFLATGRPLFLPNRFSLLP